MTLKLAADGTWVDDGSNGATPWYPLYPSDEAATDETGATGPTATTDDSAAAPSITTVSTAAVAAPKVPIPSSLTSTETAEIAYITGYTSTGTNASRSYWTDNGTIAHKWPSTTTGTSTSTVITYSFSGFNATQQATLTECLNLWASVVNVTFQYDSTGNGAFTLKLGTDGSAETNDSYYTSGSMTGRVTKSVLSIDPTTRGFELNGSFTEVDGYGIGVAVHEIGHALGLGHAGDYNGAATSSTDQYSAYDSRLWSVMSYIDPTDTSAKYYSSYPVTGTNWGGAQNPTTMMMLDILGMQEVYGASTSSNLSGGQVFGFNTNVASSIRNFYDFTVNNSPIITIWDAGTGNTLDLSGYSTNDTVKLFAGMFSSVNNLVNDIGIAYNTKIDTAIGGSGNVTFYVNDDADTIVGGSGGGNQVVFAGDPSSSGYSAAKYNRANYTLSRSDNVVTVTGNGVTDTLTNIATLVFNDTTVSTSSIACFVRGTRIATPGGEVAVERLQPGDMVLSAAGVARPVRWVGTRSYGGRFLAANQALHPVRFRRGSLGNGLPRRDLLVSPSHAMVLDGVLVQAGLLVNGTSIVRDRGLAELAYFHVELDTHDVILAEGAATETFLDEGNRGVFHNADSYAAAASDADACYCLPRVASGFRLDAIRRRLTVAEAA